MNLQQISKLTGIPTEILHNKCLRYSKNPNAKFTTFELDFFKSYFDVKNNELVVSSEINFES